MQRSMGLLIKSQAASSFVMKFTRDRGQYEILGVLIEHVTLTEEGRRERFNKSDKDDPIRETGKATLLIHFPEFK